MPFAFVNDKVIVSGEEKVIVGVVCDAKNLYQKWDQYERFTWSAQMPSDLEEAAENEETQKYAILVRNSTLLPSLILTRC